MKMTKKLGNSFCGPLKICPDIWELDTGDFVVIGEDVTTKFLGTLPDNVGVGEHERIVMIPRDLLVSAKKDIPPK